MGYDDEFDSVQDDIEELDDILLNESDGDDGQDDIECDDIIGFEANEDDEYITAGQKINDLN